jgi:putative SOS response-associated peptidase YedK
MRWGLVPYWAKNIRVGFSTINAMAETLETKPVFRDAFERRRCIVPVDAFYEWKKIDPKTKQPYAIALADKSLIPFAGLWENWKSPAGEWIRSFTIVTTTPNQLCGELHNRMPVILPPEAWSVWLGEESVERDQLKMLLVPYAGEMIAWPVSQRVGNVKNNDASLIEPVVLESQT